MSDRGKEIKGQTLTIDGSRSGASIPITQLAYDSAFNVEYVGEAKFGTPNSDNKWYIERFFYDAAFNVIEVRPALNRISLLNFTYANGDITLTGDLISQILTVVNVNDSILLTDSSGASLTSTVSSISNPIISTGLGDFDPVSIAVTLEGRNAKEFSKRIWDLRNLYIYQ